MLYKYCNTKGFDILDNLRLKAGILDNFNDPFELRLGINKDTALNNIKKEYKTNPNIIDDWKQTLYFQKINYDNNSLEDIFKKFTEFQIKDFDEQVPNTLRELELGIICFSESPDVIQMWAHYTDNHTGIVIGIDESNFDKESIITVCYRDNMVLFPVTGVIDNFDKNVKKYFREVLGRKETKWSYEKEIRLYINLDQKDQDGNYYIEIPASLIREIYLGLRSSEDTRLLAKCIKQKDEYKHLKIFKMLRHESAYKLIPKEI
jgi:hypothetical protein